MVPLIRPGNPMKTQAAPETSAIRPQQPASLDASPANDNDGVKSGDSVSGEPVMMASRGGNESDRDHGAYDDHQQPDPPSKRRILEELGKYHRRKRLRNGERNASETTSAPEVEDSGQEQDPRDEPGSQLPSEAESRDQPDHQPQQTAPTSNHQLPQATEDTRSRDGTPVPGAGDVEIPIDPALFNDQQACNDDEEDEDGNNASLCDDKGDAKPAIQTPSEAELRSYSPPEAISSRALLTPAATLEVEERESSTIHVLNGPHDSLSVDIQPQHTVNLDVNPAEDDGNDNGGNNGYNSPTSTLQMAENITQDRAMPVSDHGAPDSSPMAIQPQQQVSLDASPAEYGDYDNNPVPILHSEHLSRGARQQSGLKRKRQPQRYEQTRKRPRTRGRNAPKATATPEVEDSGQRQDPRDEPESQMLLESQAHHQPGESPSVRSSLTASSGFPNPTQQQPINLNTDQPRDDENSDDDRDFDHRGDDECADYDGGGDYGGDDISLGDDEAGQSALHREAGHGRHRDQDRAESANDMPFMAHPPTLQMRGDIARDRVRPASSTMTIQAEQPARLDAYPPEDSEESGTDNTSLAGDEDGRAMRRKIQETEHGMHRDTPSETESGAQPHFRPQQVVEDTGRSIRLDSPAVTTTPDEPSSVHSFPDRVLNASLDADPAADDSEDDSEDDDRKKTEDPSGKD
ncbi:hypothetical protein CEP52_014762 [Fusarium oligoseptatum]|uniref:Uncharacterized protein n=1 Tax=Fusarium oligoseptatum TaxID=2604345 RepID=A0A428SJ95_9HYPO|nr:hypothetical protein CEP52_014762 [Fusarium oligoseptatum]